MLPRHPLALLLPTAVLLLLGAAPLGAAGLVIPVEPDLPPLALERHDVEVVVDGQSATTTVVQIFVNNTQRRLEAQYVFPVPEGSAMSRFSMEVGGREVKGELIDKERARSIYENAVKQSGDAGLLEHLGSDVFRAKVYPIEPRSRVKVSMRYHQVLEALSVRGESGENSLVHYDYPLRNGARPGPTVHGQFSFDATIRSTTPIRNVYSPSHEVAVDRSKELEARVTYAEKHTTLSKDFQLYYSVSDEDVGLNLLTHVPVAGEPGYFLMLLSPRSRLQAKKIVERDLVFVVDTSGSMLGDKMKQAKNALRHCISNLNDGDRFGLVRFSTDVYPWNSSFADAGQDNRELALRWVDELTAQGGTDMAGALGTALAFPRDPMRPCYIVFLTDGRPTIGETIDPKKIVASVERAVSNEPQGAVRLFSWGVGYDVDTQLLDGIASVAGGVSEYVRPEEDVAAKVTEFYNKTSHPVLTSLELEVKGDEIELLDLHPRAITDLYAGSQLVLVGRFKGEGNAQLLLKGRVNDATEVFEYSASFGGPDTSREFVETLWARRRVGYLLDGIRLRGESEEVVSEVVRLSKKYGIQTPYTSFVILRDGTAVASAKRESRDRRADSRVLSLNALEFRASGRKSDLGSPSAESASGPGNVGKLVTGRAVRIPAEDKEIRDEDRLRENDVARSLEEGFEKSAGKAAVETASYLRRLKQAERADDGRSTAPFRKAGGTRFFSYRGMWVDERFEAGHQVTLVKFASPAYFRLVARHKSLIEVLKVANSLVYVTTKGRALAIGKSGKESLSDTEITALFEDGKKGP